MNSFSPTMFPIQHLPFFLTFKQIKISQNSVYKQSRGRTSRQNGGRTRLPKITAMGKASGNCQVRCLMETDTEIGPHVSLKSVRYHKT